MTVCDRTTVTLHAARVPPDVQRRLGVTVLSTSVIRMSPQSRDIQDELTFDRNVSIIPQAAVWTSLDSRVFYPLDTRACVEI